MMKSFIFAAILTLGVAAQATNDLDVVGVWMKHDNLSTSEVNRVHALIDVQCGKTNACSQGVSFGLNSDTNDLREVFWYSRMQFEVGGPLTQAIIDDIQGTNSTVTQLEIGVFPTSTNMFHVFDLKIFVPTGP